MRAYEIEGKMKKKEIKNFTNLLGYLYLNYILASFLATVKNWSAWRKGRAISRWFFFPFFFIQTGEIERQSTMEEQKIHVRRMAKIKRSRIFYHFVLIFITTSNPI